MRAVIRRGDRLVVDNIAAPEPTAGNVLCKTLVCGICGSDLHALTHHEHMIAVAERLGSFTSMARGKDVVFGHEFCCEILDHGPSSDKTLKPGTRVVAVPGAMGPGGGFESVGYSNRYPGGFAEQIVVAERLLLEVPNGLAPEHAALTEPLAVGEHAVAMADLKGNEVCLVIGCGPVGLAVIACLKARGAGPVIAADFSAVRRGHAEKMGADIIVDPAEVSPHTQWADHGVPKTRGEAMLATMAGRTVKKAVVFECVGVPGVIQNIAESAPAGTRMVVAGVCMEPDTFEPLILVNKEVELRFVFAYNQAEFAASLRMLAEGKTNYANIVTEIVPLDATPDAFVKLQTDKSQVKILVAP
ncbi:MAG TPA: zinc-binding dehydrogenase [Rhizomicrobium sp.]|jgi:2-desacetyl-2-hydroxyethyl bacteriochlorophyllide A dehydrogenase